MFFYVINEPLGSITSDKKTSSVLTISSQFPSNFTFTFLPFTNNVKVAVSAFILNSLHLLFRNFCDHFSNLMILLICRAREYKILRLNQRSFLMKLNYALPVSRRENLFVQKSECRFMGSVDNKHNRRHFFRSSVLHIFFVSLNTRELFLLC